MKAVWVCWALTEEAKRRVRVVGRSKREVEIKKGLWRVLLLWWLTGRRWREKWGDHRREGVWPEKKKAEGKGATCTGFVRPWGEEGEKHG